MSSKDNKTKILNKFKKCSAAVEENSEFVSQKCSDDELLILYASFKQATIGDCNVDEPYFYEIKKKSKYDAWKNIAGTSQENAMKTYIAKATEIFS